ncbi:hypothetical protein DXA30_02835 [Fusobacterium ulcerans]|uniref:hypothetical protein n=1 Tax=Fusobacterium ulcerans TaxID=861 RepID=UPI000E549D8C|nr:hypothetical protein [Fusobacterium ulcerans]RGY66706.1 hypothetical protein DXA30_02835 [Fusobacterium ulcerans]
MAIREIKSRFKRGIEINFANKDKTKLFHYYKKAGEELYTQEVYKGDFNGFPVETNPNQDVNDIIEAFRETLKN